MLLQSAFQYHQVTPRLTKHLEVKTSLQHLASSFVASRFIISTFFEEKEQIVLLHNNEEKNDELIGQSREQAGGGGGKFYNISHMARRDN